MLKQFVKYQSLGNDFVLFDWLKKPATFVARTLAENEWPTFVKTICDRHFGVGADGVLVLTSSAGDMAEMFIFNADGSSAQTCLNGVRCVANHLFKYHGHPKNFNIKVSGYVVNCSISEPINPHELTTITTLVAGARTYQQEKISTTQGDFPGYSVNVGNPHFVLFQPTELSWLKEHGKELESHDAFPEKTNVEFVVKEPDTSRGKKYRMLVYERGCGVTLACSSGVTAVTSLLYMLDEIKVGEPLEICMPGGSVSVLVTEQGTISLSAHAHVVFFGEFVNQE